MILVAKGEENLAKEDSTSKADFKDVPNTHWAEKFIAYAKKRDILAVIQMGTSYLKARLHTKK